MRSARLPMPKVLLAQFGMAHIHRHAVPWMLSSREPDVVRLGTGLRV